MAAERVMVEMGGERKRCTLIGRRFWSADDGCWTARVRQRGAEFAVYEVMGVWCTKAVVDHIRRVIAKK